MPATVFRPGVLYTRGHLAKLLGVECREIRWIPNVLDEVSTRSGVRYEFRRPYVTRTQAARRLHKSKTAIIAIEGTSLQPEYGPGDVRLFEVEDVDQLAGEPLGDHAHSQWLKRRKQNSKAYRETDSRQDSASNTTVHTPILHELERENAILRAMLGQHIDAWENLEFTFAQRHTARKVREMLAAQVKVLQASIRRTAQ